MSRAQIVGQIGGRVHRPNRSHPLHHMYIFDACHGYGLRTARNRVLVV
jgi:hypothetical protein